MEKEKKKELPFYMYIFRLLLLFPPLIGKFPAHYEQIAMTVVFNVPD